MIQEQFALGSMSNCNAKYQYYLDRLTPQTAVRWVIAVIAIITFCARILYLQGFYIVAYAVGIYYLNLLLLFLTPSIDPALEDDDDGPVLPSKTNDEFRPFMRRLPEFKCWHSAMKATLIAIICTFFEFFNVPVFWPILVMYFIILFFLTMKRQIMKYVMAPNLTGPLEARDHPLSVNEQVKRLRKNRPGITELIEMERKNHHMIKYKYIPFTVGKPRMAGKEDTGKVVVG
ncbi:Rer1 family protein [Ancylostoma duodenale]|uniref:Rer1 family protein n=1 Tax=Ancylostoma duodenale TaxID=51022 RepID=A0A0C2GBN1_9BILA|nr:Rer1 family protein [Ancylostoma duodenale]